MCDACVKCITCCGCCGACGKKGSRSSKKDYTPMPPTPQPYQGYQPPQTIMVYPQGPQTASFDQPSKSMKVQEDSLPHMPSWDNAVTKRVEDTSPLPAARGRGTDVEMGHVPPAQTPSPLPRLNSGPQPYPAAAVSPMYNQAHSRGYDDQYNNAPEFGVQHTDRYNRSQGYIDPYTNTDNNDLYSHEPYHTRTFSPAPTYNTLPPLGHQYDEASAFLAHNPRSPPLPTSAVSPRNPPFNTQDSPYTTSNLNTQYQQPRYPSSPPPRDIASPYPTSQNPAFHSPPSVAAMPSSPPRTTYQDPYQLQHHPQSYPQEIDTRPPSLLIAGRKPVPGSQREI